MNLLKEKKELFEWEKEYNFWIPGKRLEEHFEKCTKIEAFEKFSIGNTIYGWNNSIHMLYKIFQAKKLDKNSFNSFQEKISNLYIEKPLYEWEKEYGIKIKNISEEERNNYYFKRDFLKKLNTSFIYEDLNKINIPEKNNKTVEKSKKSNKSIINKISNTKESETLFDIIKIKKPKKEKILKKNILKRTIAVAISIVTAISSYGIANTLAQKELTQNNSYISRTDNINTNNSDKKIHMQVIDKSIETNNNNKDNIGRQQKQIVESDKILENSTKEKIDNITENNNKIESETSENTYSISLNDEITFDENAKIYTNINNCINNKNELQPYYSLDKKRYIKSVELEYDNKKIYTSNQKELDELLNKGATILVVGTSLNSKSKTTDEGYYSFKNVKILKKDVKTHNERIRYSNT